MEQLII